MNTAWDTYGCEVCDDYPLLVLEVNHRVDTKAEFVEHSDNINVKCRKVSILWLGEYTVEMPRFDLTLAVIFHGTEYSSDSLLGRM